MSSNYGGDPDWTNPVAAEPTATGVADAPVAKADKANLVQRLLSFLNIGICAMMFSLGILGLVEFEFTNLATLSDVFVAAYMLLFAGLLFTYELLWWTNINSINRMMRKNFGFLYGIKGKAFFIVFAAFLTIGMEGEVRVEYLRWATGIMW
eukprot:CAMPEP_0172494644 /NCGR_PEP_ID=MMETSP1066-20121228/52236_1 /TAXON_ID=671091 /ORGANISM="Coscinodiscus wailesii, Strain CCMP2513" /LENGTH=150 /DNA_ID=CAMNT_0013265783 /DNA_START=73 /DNA_END=522 /DNA_ORIENTATION=-